MDQRTRERLPVLPVLVRAADERRLAAAARPQAAGDSEPGALIPITDGALRRAVAPKATGRHFEKRKVSIRTCARAFGTPCIHEHACVRRSLLRPDPAQRARLEEIRDNLIARIAEAEREGWLGEVEGLQVSLAGANDMLAQLDRRARNATTVDLGIPAFAKQR